MNDRDAIKLCVDAASQSIGDDLFRARSAFSRCTEEQMNQHYGESGKTRREILNGYEDHARKWLSVIGWLSELEQRLKPTDPVYEAQITKGPKTETNFMR